MFKLKTSHMVFYAILALPGLFSSLAYAQIDRSSSESNPRSSPLGVGPHHKQIETMVILTNAAGLPIQQNSRYVALATGMNYLENGVWKETMEVIQPSAEGAAAKHGFYKVRFFNGGEKTGAVQLILPSGAKQYIRPVGLYYHDRETGHWSELASTKSSTGVIIPPNQVLFEDAFGTLSADILYTYCKGKFSVDVILRESPPEPRVLQLNNETTDLQFVTEFEQEETPVVVDSPQTAEIDVRNGEGVQTTKLNHQEIAFREARLSFGKAYAVSHPYGGNNSEPIGSAIVRNAWLALEDRSLLLESINYSEIEASLSQLPTSARGRNPKQTEARSWTKAAAEASLPTNVPMQYGLMPARSGFVIDPTIIITGLQTPFTFAAGTTYEVQDNFEVTGQCQLNAAFIKYRRNKGVTLRGPVQGSGGAILTALDDNTPGRGEIVTGSTGDPAGYYASYGLSLILSNGNHVTIPGLKVYFAATAVYAFGYSNPGVSTVTLQSPEIYHSSSAFVHAGGSLYSFTVLNPTLCGVANHYNSTAITHTNDIVCANTAPSIVALPTVVLLPDSTINQAVSLNDNETPNALSVTVQSSNPTLIPPTAIIVTNAVQHPVGGLNRILRITPTQGEVGESLITVTVSDGTLAANASFNLIVSDPPSIRFTGYSPQETPNLIIDRYDRFAWFSIELSDPNPLYFGWSYGNVQSTFFDNMALEGSGTTRYLRIKLNPGQPDTAVVYINMTDSNGINSSRSLFIHRRGDNSAQVGPPPQFGAPGNTEPTICANCSDSDSSGPNSSPPNNPSFGPCSEPDFSRFKRRLALADTKDIITFPQAMTDEDYSFQAEEGYPAGSRGCDYQLEITYRYSIRNNANDRVYIGGGIEHPSPVESNGGTSMFTSGPLTRRAKFRGGCEQEWGIGIEAPDRHGSSEGQVGAYLEVIDIKVKGAVYTGEEPCSSEQNLTGTCTFGEYDFELSSVDFSFSSGRTRFGQNRSALTLYSALASITNVSPQSLASIGANPYAERLYSQDGQTLKQLRTAHGVSEISQQSSSMYRVRFHPNSAILNSGLKDTNGLYVLSSTNVYRCIEVCNPIPGDGKCLKVSVFDGSSTNATEFIYDYFPATLEAPERWQLKSGNALRLVHKSLGTGIGGDPTEATVVLDPNTNSTLLEFCDSYTTIGSTAFLSERCVGPTNSSLITSYSYYTNASSSSYGKISLIQYSYGGWQTASYYNGRLHDVGSIIGNSEINEYNGRRGIGYYYGSEDLSDNLSYLPSVPRVERVYVNQGELSRTIRIISFGEMREYVCIDPMASWTATNNLLTTTRWLTNGAFKGRLASVRAADGSLTTYSYSTNSESMTTVVDVGAPGLLNSNIVENGIRTIRVIANTGAELTNSVLRLPTMIVTSREVHSQFDEISRARRTDYLDGTFVLRKFDCCGLSELVDRDGVTNSFAYDELRRLVSETRLGVTKHYIYDGAGRVVRVERGAYGVPNQVMSENFFDTAGRLIEERDAGGVRTVFSETVDAAGQRCVTTTFAAGTSSATTKVQTYFRDGTLATLTGTAVQPVRYVYGQEVLNGFLRRFTQEIRLLDDGSDSAESTKTFFDGANRIIRRTYGAQSTAFETFNYDAQGRLANQRDPNGVQSLSSFSPSGQYDLKAIDLNDNGVIDLLSDRIVQQVVDYVTNSASKAVQRVRSYSWHSFGSTNSTLISTEEICTDGSVSWRSDSSGTSSNVILRSTNGFRVDSSFLVDGSSRVLQYYLGRLVWEEFRNSGGIVVSRRDFDYDALGRQF